MPVSVLRAEGRAAEEPRTGYGIMVLSASTGKVLYANENASRYLAVDEIANAFVPVLDELVRQITARAEPDSERPPFESTRLVIKQGAPVLLQAFGVRNRTALAVSRVVITMQDFTPCLASSEGGAMPPPR
jgi:hypothetical protein